MAAETKPLVVRYGFIRAHWPRAGKHKSNHHGLQEAEFHEPIAEVLENAISCFCFFFFLMNGEVSFTFFFQQDTHTLVQKVERHKLPRADGVSFFKLTSHFRRRLQP